MRYWKPLLLGLVVSLALGALAQTPPRQLKIFLGRGKDAVSDLTSASYVDSLKQGPFEGSSVTVNTESQGKKEFLDNFVKSDVVYVNAHTQSGVKAPWYTLEGTKVLEQRPLVVSNGETVFPGEVAQALRTSGKGGPSLVIIAGCSTLDNDKVNFARAMGISDSGSPRAYLGWKGKVVGVVADRFFKTFLEGFMKPDEQGRYRSLEEAKAYALSHGASEGGASFEILGNPKLTRTDLGKAVVAQTSGKSKPPEPSAKGPTQEDLKRAYQEGFDLGKQVRNGNLGMDAVRSITRGKYGSVAPELKQAFKKGYADGSAP